MMHISFLFIGTTELLLIGGMALLLFGGKKLPEMMRGLGKGVREFKKGVRDVEEELHEQPKQEEQADGSPPHAPQANETRATDNGN